MIVAVHGRHNAISLEISQTTRLDIFLPWSASRHLGVGRQRYSCLHEQVLANPPQGGDGGPDVGRPDASMGREGVSSTPRMTTQTRLQIR